MQRSLQSIGISQGIDQIFAGFSRRSEASLHVEAIKELSESFGSEAAPMVIDVEGQTRRLTGTAAAQYESWALPVAVMLTVPIAMLGAATSLLGPTADRLALKWPNDILVDGYKISGMLSELEAEEQVLLFKVPSPQERGAELYIVVQGLYEDMENDDQDNALLLETLVRKYLDGSGGAALWVSHNPEHLERVATIFITMHQDGLQIRKENDLISPQGSIT